MSSLHTNTPHAQQSAQVHTDGRTSRGERSKKQIISAALSLIGEGGALTIASVALRADLSIRTVFQHCRCVDGLYSTLRVKILYELIDGLVCIQELQGKNLEARVLSAIEELRRVFVPDVQTMRRVNWVFGSAFLTESFSSDEAEVGVQFNDKMQSIVSMLLVDEKQHFGQRDNVAYTALRSILGAQLHPKMLVPLLTEGVSFVGLNHMLVGTIREFLRALTKPA